jgi:hypothetical protein
MPAKDALMLWNELFERRELILKAFKATKTLPSTVVQGEETIENAVLIVKAEGIFLSGTRVAA